MWKKVFAMECFVCYNILHIGVIVGIFVYIYDGFVSKKKKMFKYVLYLIKKSKFVSLNKRIEFNNFLYINTLN